MSAIPGATVRAAEVGDAAQLAAVHVRSWQAAYCGLLPQEYLDQLDPAERTGRWRQILRDMDRSRGGVIVVADDAEMLGFAAFGPTRDADEDPSRVGEVRAIYLLAQAWGKALGRQLMDTALKCLATAGYEEATLWVLTSNARARRFYARGGWTMDGAVQEDDSRGFIMVEVRYRRPLP
jgi:GNAT superfamily N-acetyltransferase